MAHAYHHAISSAQRFGGVPEDYAHVHNFMDSSKSAWADQRHRVVFHTSFGIYVTETVIGLEEEVRLLRGVLNRIPRWVHRLLGLKVPKGRPTTLQVSSGRAIPIRFIAEQHVKEDFGFIPSLGDYMKELPKQPWMYRGALNLSKHVETHETQVEKEGTAEAGNVTA